MQLGSQRRGHFPSKFDKSPFVRNGDLVIGNGAPGSGGPGRISNQRVGGVHLSMAARKKEM
jgi:hypothetical protein